MAGPRHQAGLGQRTSHALGRLDGGPLVAALEAMDHSNARFETYMDAKAALETASSECQKLLEHVIAEVMAKVNARRGAS